MEPTTLQQHIAKRIEAGTTKDAIKEQVIAVGWSEEEFDKAYADALIASGVPVPSAGSRSTYGKRASTGDIVLNFFSFILLGIVVSALGTLYFAVINRFFPDALDSRVSYYYRNIADTIHYAIAALVVAFPLYYLAVRLWFKRFREDEAKTESKLTKWITYLVLLASSVTIVGDLIFVLYTFLQGEESVRFVLKALTVFVIAGMVFGFYFLERKKIQYRGDIPRRTFQLFGYVLTVLVVAGVVLGFVSAGGPATERKRSFDDTRASNLASLTSCVQTYAREFKRLPNTLEDLRLSPAASRCVTQDPETKAPYEYRVVTPLVRRTDGMYEGSIELCAVFGLATSGGTTILETEPVWTDEDMYYYGNGSSVWQNHPAGRACDTQSITTK